MGFDPRSWARTPAPAGGPQVTCNLDSLLAENEALRREVRALRRQLAQFHQAWPGEDAAADTAAGRAGVTGGRQPELTGEQVQRWGEALARHPRWKEVRVGASLRIGASLSFSGLKGVVEEQRRRWRNPAGDLEEELDRLAPGLGTDLRQALRGPQSRVRWAVRAAFAVYGFRAADWLSGDPGRVVDELLTRIARLEAAAQAAEQAREREQARQQARAQAQEPPRDPRRAEAYARLGLRWGASRESVKGAHRRLVKRHHPDLGGDPELFRLIHDAYLLLTA